VSDTRNYSSISCVPVTLAEARRIGKIESSFTTNRVLRLRRKEQHGEIEWALSAEQLPQPYTKRYDRGSVDDWLEAYAEAQDFDRFRFIAARLNDRVLGILTWEAVTWNDTLTLVDIRVRAEGRGRGIGTALVDALKSEARRQTVRGIGLETQINNEPAIRFYQSRGFVISGFNDHLYSNRDLDAQDVALFMFWEREDTGPGRRRI
jgi:ribosomal protein S18 acetylase RimI-like enzyme